VLVIPDKESSWQRYLLPAGLFAGAIALLVLSALALNYLLRSDTDYATTVAEVGSVAVNVNAYGRLAARQASSIIAEVEGTVTKIHRYPGAALEPGDVLLELVNPQLERQYDSAEFEVLEARAQIEATRAALQREALNLANEVALLENRISMSQRELEVMTSLAKDGIIASLELVKAQTLLTELKLQHQLKIKSLETFETYRDAEMRAVSYALERAEKMLELAQYELASLTVKAQQQGVLDELAEQIESGRSVQRGELLAKVTDPASLYADVYISVADASRVQAGMPVTVAIRNQTVKGEVLRVYPSARNNQVRLELVLTESLPAQARPQTDVTAVIHVAEQAQTLRIETPAYLDQNSQETTLLVVSAQGITEQKVMLGLIGKEHTEVLSGLNVGDRVLLSRPQ